MRRDDELLRQAFAAAGAAVKRGDPPFGAVVAADDGAIVAEAGSTQNSTRDTTAHAEMNAVREAMATTPRARLASSTLYASAEPCAMCSAAIFYAGISRIVYGLPEERFRSFRNKSERTAGLPFSCRAILGRPARRVEIVGPRLEDEAWRLHEHYWTMSRDD